MSHNIWQHGGLRFWNEAEVQFRDQCIERLTGVVKDTLTKLNPAWSFNRCECPILTPREYVNLNYTNEDLFVTNHNEWVLRPETTPSSYAYAEYIMSNDKRARAPFCVWQSGKSFRRELVDGATAGKLRYNEFYQLEFQCIYSIGTKADYQGAVLAPVAACIKSLINVETSTVDSDRLPVYSERTIDIEASHRFQNREVASISVRKDFQPDKYRVLEIAIGLDRLVQIWQDANIVMWKNDG